MQKGFKRSTYNSEMHCILHIQDPRSLQNLLDIFFRQAVKDSAISMCNDASYYMQITKMSAKYKQLSGWILKAFKTRDQENMLTPWKTSVVRHLDYRTQLWSTHSGELTTDHEVV